MNSYYDFELNGDSKFRSSITEGCEIDLFELHSLSTNLSTMLWFPFIVGFQSFPSSMIILIHYWFPFYDIY